MGTKEGKVINLREVNNKVTYRFVKDIKIEEVKLKNGNKRSNNVVIIMLEQNRNGIIRRKVHPLTLYLLQTKKGGSKYSPITQNNKATLIVKFLNYVLIDNYNRFKLNNFQDILFEHGTDFLNSLSNVSNETIDRYKTELTKFYYYLANEGVLRNIKPTDFEVIRRDGQYGTQSSLASPFFGVEYNDNESLTVIHKLPLSLVTYFIDTAIIHAPQIALGICFQFFGGLRLGEVINLRRSSIKVKGPSGKYGFVLNLKDTYMRQDLKHPVAGGSVKIKRRQAVFPFGGAIVQKVYEMHMKQNVSNNDQNALFTNANGKPMADFTYRYYFEKVKSKFIERLKTSEHVEIRHYAIELESVKWSTHIGRGIFSNVIASVSKNILEIAQARGDAQLDSSLTYLSDSDKMAMMLFENDKDMWKSLEEYIAEIEGNNCGIK